MKTWFTLSAAALMLLLAMNVGVNAEEKVVAASMQEEKLPSPDALKIVAGTAEGHKTPTEVLTKAIKAAKDGKMDALKSCFTKDAQKQLDETYYGNNKEQKYIEVVAQQLAGLDPAKLSEIPQNTCGKYAIIKTETEKGTHFIRTSWAVKNWYLKDYHPDDYSRNYMNGMEDIKKIIESGTGAKLKEKLEAYETETLELLVGVQEGVDPYDLLLKRIKKITTGEGKPKMFLNYWSAEIALWFNNPKAEGAKDSFLAIRLTPEWDSKSGATSYVAKVGLYNTAQFHKRAGYQFTYWVQDWEYSYPTEEEGEGK
jgi:hypothetical protein